MRAQNRVNPLPQLSFRYQKQKSVIVTIGLLSFVGREVETLVLLLNGTVTVVSMSEGWIKVQIWIYTGMELNSIRLSKVS